MTTQINAKNTSTQTVQGSPNLGGPTTTYLDKSEKQINRDWAKRYELLNGGE